MDEKLMLDRWRGGNDRAGEILLGRHVPVVYRFFRRRCPANAEDLTQKTMLAILEARARLKPNRSIRSYFLGIARHVLFDHLGRRGALASQGQSIVDDADTPSWAAAQREDRGRLLRALRSLPLSQQLTLELFYWEHLTTAEVGDVLEVPAGTVKWRLSEARRALRRELDSLPAAPAQTVTADTRAWLRSMQGARERA